MYRDNIDISVMKGKTLKEVSGSKQGSDEINFLCTDGTAFKLYHEPDCCESVSIEDITGEWDDIIGRPLLVAEEVSSLPSFTDPYAGKSPYNYEADAPYVPESYTWTFYRLGTERGFVTLRWLGTSNGYYSERVSFVQL